MKQCVDLLGECLDSDWCRVKDHNTMLCNFALGKCQQRLECHADAIYQFTEAMKLVDEKQADMPYIYFRRAWSYKVKLRIEDAYLISLTHFPHNCRPWGNTN